MVNMSKKQKHRRDEKCQHKSTHESLMNDEENLTPTGRLKLAPKLHYTRVQRNRCLYINWKSKRNKKIYTLQRFGLYIGMKPMINKNVQFMHVRQTYFKSCSENNNKNKYWNMYLIGFRNGLSCYHFELSLLHLSQYLLAVNVLLYDKTGFVSH